MAEQSGIFPSVNGDRRYFTAFFAGYFADFISNGIYPNPSTQCQVLANNDMTITLKPGNAYINGYKYINDSDKSLTIETADGVLKRIDRIVLRYTTLNREIKSYVKKGTFASTPVAPSLQRDADMWELGVADIYIANGAVSISQANITDLRLNNTLCGIVHGVVDQVDTTTIFNQFQTWYLETVDVATTDIATMLSAFQNSFNTWFMAVQGTLSGDVAGNLLNLINDNTTDITANTANITTINNRIELQERSISAAIPAVGWTESAPYIVTISVPGITANDTPRIFPVYAETVLLAEAQIDAYGCITLFETGANTITFVCFTNKPSVEVPIKIKGA